MTILMMMMITVVDDCCIAVDRDDGDVDCSVLFVVVVAVGDGRN